MAQQVGEAIKDFTGNRRLFVLNVYGGQSIERQIRSLQRGVQIVVGTPGRIIDLLERGKLHLDQLKVAVLDEADEMLSMGFIDDVKTILRQSSDQRQTACFSATMPREIKELIKQLKGLSVLINLIPFNPFPNSGYKTSSNNAVRRFQDVLMKAGLTTVIRKTRGEDIDAACGQLVGKVADKSRREQKFIKPRLGMNS